TVAATESRRRQDVQDHLAELLRLSDVAVLQQLQTIGSRLMPTQRDDIPKLEDWLAEASGLTSRLPADPASLPAMRERAERPEAATGTRSRLNALMQATSPAPKSETWTFESAEDQWQHDTLVQLIANVEAFNAPDGLVEQITAGLKFQQAAMERRYDAV